MPARLLVPPEDTVDAIVISGPAFLAELTRSFISARCPDTRVEMRHSDDGAPSVRVAVAGSAAWMLVLTGASPETVVAAVSMGATALLTLDCSPAEFESALDALRNGGGPFVPPRLLRMVAEHGGDGQQKDLHLTPREREVLTAIAAGLANREIAARLCISQNTVRTHIQALSTKLGIHGRHRLAAFAAERRARA